jgi:hypothetical protein
MGRGVREESGMIGVAFLREAGVSRQCGVGNRGRFRRQVEKQTGCEPGWRCQGCARVYKRELLIIGSGRRCASGGTLGEGRRGAEMEEQAAEDG